MTTIELANIDDFNEFVVDDIFMSLEIADVNTREGVNRVVRYVVSTLGKKNIVYKYYYPVGEAFTYKIEDLRALEKRAEEAKKELIGKLTKAAISIIDGVVVS